MMARMSVDLPQPDSPTRPGCDHARAPVDIVEHLCDALVSVRIDTFRPRTESRGIIAPTYLDAIAGSTRSRKARRQKVEAHDRDQDGRPGRSRTTRPGRIVRLRRWWGPVRRRGVAPMLKSHEAATRMVKPSPWWRARSPAKRDGQDVAGRRSPLLAADARRAWTNSEDDSSASRHRRAGEERPVGERERQHRAFE